jgi:hypothetical protein
MRAGQAEVVTAVLISGLLITSVSAVYFWGLPVIYKSRDNALITNAEDFMFFLDKTIKSTAAAADGSRENIRLSEPGILRISGGKVIYSIQTDGTIYSTDAPIQLGRTKDCDSTKPGMFGQNEPAVICVSSNQISESSYTNVYSLSYKDLEAGLKVYRISVTGNDVSSPKSTLIIENTGVGAPSPMGDGRELITVNIRITLQ